MRRVRWKRGRAGPVLGSVPWTEVPSGLLATRLPHQCLALSATGISGLTRSPSTSHTSVMAAHSSWFPFGLDGLIAEAKRRMHRRWLLAGIGAGVVAAGAVAAYAMIPGQTGGLVTARYDGVSVGYPRLLTRVDCGESGPHLAALALLTTSRPAPSCSGGNGGFSFPPRESLGRDGVSVALALQALLPGMRPTWNARLDGHPAIVGPFITGQTYHQSVSCPAGVPREGRSVAIQDGGGLLTVNAVICGPNLSAGESIVGKVLAGVHITR